MFFVFDGVDGAGKSTQLERFAQWLTDSGREVVTCKDPGSTQLGERLRELLLTATEMPIHIRTEMMMFTTARTQLVEEIIRPAIGSNKVVVLDRYFYSTMVYQGYAGDLDPAALLDVNLFATDGLLPDATFVLDIPVDVAMKRLGDDLDRMESRGEAYFQKVRDGFLAIGKQEDSVHVVDATQSVEDIESEIRKIATSILSEG